MIHKYKINDTNILIDVNSGSVHIIDPLSEKIVDDFLHKSKDEILNSLKNKYDNNEILETYEDVKTLYEQGKLFSKEILVEPKERNPVVKALCLHVTHDCNLKCKYCFATEGTYQSNERSLMSYEVGKKALDFLIKKSGNRKNLEVDFFGGEPLMNFEVVKKLVDYGREQEKIYDKNFRFTITTNGVLLDESNIDYINKNMQNVVLSLDGRKKVNDNMRKNFSTKSTYDVIVPKFIELANKRNQSNYYVRGTFTRHNLDFSEDVMHLAELGFEQISVEPVVLEQSNDMAIKKEDLQTIFKEYENLAEKIIEYKNQNKYFNFFHYMIDLSAGPCVYKRVSGCGAGTEYLAITPTGDIYPCHQFVGQDEFKLGSLDDDVLNTSLIDKFDSCNITTKEDCKNCWAKYYCSGGCSSNAYNFNKDIYKPYEIGCEMQKKRIECAIYVLAKQEIRE